MSSKRTAADDVIDLTLDSDDEQDMGSNRDPSNSASGVSTPSSKRARTDNASQAASAMNGSEDDVQKRYSDTSEHHFVESYKKYNTFNGE